MISNFIVVSSLLLALLFTVAWLARPDLRRRIEEPKHLFQEQVERYNPHGEGSRDDLKGDSDGRE